MGKNKVAKGDRERKRTERVEWRVDNFHQDSKGRARRKGDI